MRVFIGYGYNDRDKWVEEHVFPLVTAFGCDVVHGKTVYGGTLPEEVKKAIRGSEAMIGFTTRRDPIAPNQFGTHPWVIQELGVADAQDPPIPWVEVREEGVASPGGILDAVNAQRITYREQDRAVCLVQIAQALRRFRDQTNVTTIRLGPVAAVEQISPLLEDRSFSCTCQTLRGITLLPARQVPVLPIKGGLFVQLRGLEPGELIRLMITAGGHAWRSSFESVDTVDIQVKE